jgi:hypothetical protein
MGRLYVMEATPTHWRPPFYLLEDAVECWVAIAGDVKNVPGRPKTDRLDAIWLAKRTLVQERMREKQRAEKLLEDRASCGRRSPGISASTTATCCRG